MITITVADENKTLSWAITISVTKTPACVWKLKAKGKAMDSFIARLTGKPD